MNTAQLKRYDLNLAAFFYKSFLLKAGSCSTSLQEDSPTQDVSYNGFRIKLVTAESAESCIHLPAYLSTCLPTCLLPTTCLPAYIPAYLPGYLPGYLATCLPACLLTYYLPTCLATHKHILAEIQETLKKS